MYVSEAFQYLHSLRAFGFQPGLDSTRSLAAAAGNPQYKLRFIHVAGTNGKGSVCAFLESIYRHSGLRVGLYTSPHLVRFGERIQIQRQPISSADLERHILDLRSIVQTLPGLEPTLFEFTTVLALRYFAEQKVDVVILETGLGGRLDATNIVTPLASVITQVGLDHMQVLGSDIPSIAAEKAGIIKPGVPVLTSAEDPDAEAILRFKARELDCPYLLVGAAEVAALRMEVGLTGPHQRVNAALAAATVRMLRVFFPVHDEHLQKGLATTEWPGRLQVVERDGRKVILDGAHNLPGVRALKEALPALVGSVRPTLVLGMLTDKDCSAMLKELVPLAGRVLTAPVANSRSVSAEDLRTAAVATGAGRPVRAVASLSEALKLCSADSLVVITGSLYFIGEAMELLEIGVTSSSDERVLNEWLPRDFRLAG